MSLFLIVYSAYAQQSNVTLLGRWGKGHSEAVFRRGGYTFVGDGAYLEVYKNRNSSYRKLDSILLPGPVEDVWVRNDTTRVYIVCGNEGLQLTYFDYRSEKFTGIRAYLATPGFASSIMQYGNYVYIADGNSGLIIVDVTNFYNPRLRGQQPLSGFARGVWVANDSTVLVAADTVGFYSIDVSNPNNPIIYDSLNFATPFPNDSRVPIAYNVLSIDTVAYVACGIGGMRTVSISDPANLDSLGIWVDTKPVDVRDVWVANHYAYLVCGKDGFYSQIDISDPASPARSLWLPLYTKGFSSAIVTEHDTAFIGDCYNGHLIVNVDPFSQPYVLDSLKTADLTYDVDISSEYAYTAVGKSGLKIFSLNISNPPADTLTEVSSYNTPGEALGIRKSGSYVYIADGSKGLAVFNVSDPLNPIPVQEDVASGDTCYDVDVSGGYAFLAAGHDGIRVVDISGTIFEISASPFHTPGTPSSARAVKVVNNKLYVADSSGVYVYDISNLPNNMIRVDSLTTGDLDVLGIDVVGDTVFVANGRYGFLLWNLSTESVEKIATGGKCTDISVKDKTIYITDSQNGLRIFDISVPGAFIETGYYNTGSVAKRLAVLGNRVCVADGKDGLYVFRSEIRPRISVTPARLNFGPVPRGESRPLILWVINTGNTLLRITDVSVPYSYSSEFSFSNKSFWVVPNDTFKLVINYEPTKSVQYTSSGYSTVVTIRSNDPDSSSLTRTLQFNGELPITVDPYSPDELTIGLWHFDETAGTTVTDASIHQLDGQLQGTPTREASSKTNFGNDILFDGQNDWVKIPFNNLLNLWNTPFTVGLWFSMAEKPSGYYILARRGNYYGKNSDTQQFQLALGKNEGIMGSVWDSNGHEHTLSAASMDELNVNQWYHVALTWDGDSLRLYLNSILKDAEYFRGELRSEATEPLAIGSNSRLNAPFYGSIDEVRISNVARQPWEFNVNHSHLVVEEEKIDFGSVLNGYFRRIPLKISNTGSQSLEIDSVYSSNSAIQITPPVSHSSKLILGKDEYKTLWITFSPQGIGALTSDLFIESSDPTFPSFDVSLTGEALASMPIGAYETDPFTLGLYDFDGAGDTVYDWSGNEMHGSWYGVNRPGGRFGNCLGFDGQDDICLIKPKAGLPIGPRWGGLTVEAWFYLEAPPSKNEILVRRGNNSEFQFDLFVDSNSKVVGRVTNEEKQIFTVSGGQIQDTTWYHVAMSFEKDMNFDGGILHLYINGDEVAADTVTGELAGTVPATWVDTLSIHLGRDWANTEPLYGKIDEFRISNVGREPWEFNVNMARVEVAPATMDFGNVLVGEKRILKLWVKNIGIDVLDVNDISITPYSSLFGVEVTSFSVQPGDSQSVKVTYTPTNTDTALTQLILVTNDPSPSGSRKRVILKGIGINSKSVGPYTSDIFTLGLYHFDESSGTTAGDSSGGERDGLLYGGMVWVGSGRFGGALEFDGVDDWVLIPKSSLYGLRQGFSVEFWFSILTKPADSCFLFRLGRADTTEIGILLDKNKGIIATIGTQDTLFAGSLDSLNLNQWYHILFSSDGDSMSLALNNIVKDHKHLSGSLNFVSTDSLNISGTSEGRYFHGYIDELRISNVARERWEINVLPPTIAVFPTELNFATVLLGKSRTVSFSVTNQGDQDLVISEIRGGGGVFTLPDTGFTLSRLNTREIPVTYTPSVANTTNNATLTIVSNDTAKPTVDVILEGSSTDKQGITQYKRDSHTIALYHFNETKGDTALDASLHGHNGLLHGGVTRTDGFFDKGLLFDGVDDYVSVDTSQDLTFDMTSRSFSIEAFFRTDTLSQVLISKGYQDTNHKINYRISINNQARLEVEGFGSGGPSVNDNAWHHVVFIYDHLTQIGTLYLDGVKIWSRSRTDTEKDITNRPLIFGAAEADSIHRFNYFKGYLDEIRISDIIRQPWEFQVADYGIKVDSVAPDPPELGKDLTINLHVPDGKKVSLYYRNGGTETYQEMAADSVDSVTYKAVLPGTAVTLSGLEYYVKVITTNNDTLTYPSLDPQNNPNAEIVHFSGLKSPLTFNREFQMFSIPFELDTSTVESVLEDDLGPYDPYSWRLFWWHIYQAKYIDYNPKTKDIPYYFELVPGRAYWLVTNFEKTFDIGSGHTVSTDSSYQIGLQPGHLDTVSLKLVPGWNMIGTPYNFSVLWNDCSVSSHSVKTLYYYDGKEFKIDWPVMEPWKGYFICNEGTKPATLYILPRAAKAVTIKAIPEKGVLAEFNKNEWLFKLSAETGNAYDTDNFAGVRLDAKEGWDFRDRAEPPPVGSYVSLYFEHKDWQYHPETYTADIRGPDKNGYIWEFAVETMVQEQPVTIHWTLYQKLPEGWKAYLLDLDQGVSTNMLRNKSIEYNSSKEIPNYHRFKMIVGTKEFVENHNDGIPLVPVKFALFQNYPNPFNPDTKISYSIPKKCEVEIVIFNIIGQRVKKLVRSVKNAGRYQVIWDGRDDQGRFVSSGVYIYRLKAAGKVATRKMIVLR